VEADVDEGRGNQRRDQRRDLAVEADVEEADAEDEAGEEDEPGGSATRNRSARQSSNVKGVEDDGDAVVDDGKIASRLHRQGRVAPRFRFPLNEHCQCESPDSCNVTMWELHMPLIFMHSLWILFERMSGSCTVMVL